MSEIILSQSGSAIKNKVLQNTFRLLGVSMIPTVIGAWLGTQMSWAFAASSPWLFFFGYLAVIFGLIWGINKNKDSGTGVVLLLAMTGVMGVMTGPLLQAALHMKNGADLVMMAGGGTALAFFGISTIASNPNKDFSKMGGYLFAGLITIIFASIANMFFHIPMFSVAISAVSVLLFAGYALYDVNQIVRGGETNYVMATLSIYLDVYNMFVNLLRVLMALTGDD